MLFFLIEDPILMPPKKRKIKQKIRRKRIKNFANNIGLLILSLIVMGFIFSTIERIFFNTGFNTDFPDFNTLITKSSYEKKTGHKIQVEIWNGCGVPRLASIYTEYLRSEGIDVLDSKNADNFHYSETKILHHRGDIERALELADIMMIDKNRIIKDHNEDLFFDLTLILGEDHSKLPSYRDAIIHQNPF